MNATRNIFVFIFFLVFIFLLHSAVFAQEYVFETGGNNSYTTAQKISNPQKLQYIYGIVTQGDDKIDYYEIELDKTTPNMQISLVVPSRNEFSKFEPTLILIDPRLKVMQGDVPFGFPTNVGGAVYPWPKGSKKLYTDKMLFEDLKQGPQLTKNMPNGRYVVAVFDPLSMGGRYALLVGAAKPEENIISKFISFLALIRIKFNLY